jgi:hypothetical protein
MKVPYRTVAKQDEYQISKSESVPIGDLIVGYKNGIFLPEFF